MSLGHQQYSGVIRRYVMGFGSLFNDISINRKDVNRDRVQTIGVPIAYGPKQAWLVRLKEDPNLSKKVAIQLPRMGFEITGMMYSPMRKLSSTIKNSALNTSDLNRVKTQYTPVPFDFNFMLSIFVKNTDDGAQILEQILPYFRPEFTLNLNLVPEMDLVVDTPVVFQSLSTEDVYEGDFESRQVLVHNLDFLVKGYLYGPTDTTGIIKRSITNIHGDTAADSPRIEKITVTPSQYANGAPLHSPSANAELSVSTNNISANSDYGFTLDINTDAWTLKNND